MGYISSGPQGETCAFRYLFGRGFPLRARANADGAEPRGRTGSKKEERLAKAEGRAQGGREGCSTYKRAVAGGATRLPTFPPLAFAGGSTGGWGAKEREYTKRTKKRERERVRDEDGAKGAARCARDVHLIHPSTVPSFLLLLMIACTLPPSMHRTATTTTAVPVVSAAAAASTAPATAAASSTPGYIQRGTHDGEGEPNYQNTPPPTSAALKHYHAGSVDCRCCYLVGYHPRHV